MSRRRQPGAWRRQRVRWYQRAAAWLRAWQARREQKRRWATRAAEVRNWIRRAEAGEDICIGCGGPLERFRVAERSLVFRDKCRRCVGDHPPVSIDWARCTVCSQKDPTRRITVPVELEKAKRVELAKLIEGVCPDCVARMGTLRGRKLMRTAVHAS